MKSFAEVVAESTCKKRVVVCELYDTKDRLLARESNRCDPKGGKCERLGVVQSKLEYSDENCNWTHAEIRAINSLPTDMANGVARPVKATIYGQPFACKKCADALEKAGVYITEFVSDDRWKELGVGIRPITDSIEKNISSPDTISEHVPPPCDGADFQMEDEIRSKSTEDIIHAYLKKNLKLEVEEKKIIGEFGKANYIIAFDLKLGKDTLSSHLVTLKGAGNKDGQ